MANNTNLGQFVGEYTETDIPNRSGSGPYAYSYKVLYTVPAGKKFIISDFQEGFSSGIVLRTNGLPNTGTFSTVSNAINIGLEEIDKPVINPTKGTILCAGEQLTILNTSSFTGVATNNEYPYHVSGQLVDDV